MRETAPPELEQLLSLPADTLQRRFAAALVDADGREIPITETMIQTACQALEQAEITGLHCPPATPAR